MHTIFTETQRFTQWWLWMLILGTAAFPIFGLYKQILLGEPYGDNPMSDAGLIVASILIFTVVILFLIIRLKTVINSHEIGLLFFPFTQNKVKWEDVKDAKVVKYGFVGYGIRLWTKYGTVYNIKGNNGLAIELKNGSKLLIGTQREIELKEFLNRLKKQTE
ncbi:MAG: hypothetical protein Salg2KO_05490 [Salibacteraceae bacterium]